MNMDYEDNERPVRPLNPQSSIVDWVFLPIPMALVVVGLGILTGLLFKDNLMLQGPWKPIFGVSLTAYGAFRCILIARRIMNRKKDKLWIKKS
jgi:hypothetical protein